MQKLKQWFLKVVLKVKKRNNKMAEKITYDKAKAELEQILEELEGGEVGIDQLAKLVKRANELIKLCKDKLKATDEEVKTILESFED
jgi:exodeoxyribonuclease VII small subunit